MPLPVQSLVVRSGASFISLPDTTLLAQSLFPKGLSLVLVSLKHGGKITEILNYKWQFLGPPLIHQIRISSRAWESSFLTRYINVWESQSEFWGTTMVSSVLAGRFCSGHHCLFLTDLNSRIWALSLLPFCSSGHFMEMNLPSLHLCALNWSTRFPRLPTSLVYCCLVFNFAFSPQNNKICSVVTCCLHP